MAKKMSFEEANQKLEQAIKKMESKTLTLEESLKVYEEASLLLNYCYKELDRCKGQVQDINQRIAAMKENDEEFFND